MKKTLMLLVIAIIGVSCISEDMDSTKLDLKHLDPFVEKMAPVQDGMKTVISVDGKVICETTIEIPYLVPKGKTATIEYQPVTKDGYENGGYATYQFMAMFEDTRNGDNDYNDFVCYITTRDKFTVTEEHNPNKRTIYAQPSVYVQPLALGATKSFKFGIKFPNGEIWMATPNSVRTDFFDSRSGFINVDFVPSGTIPDSYFRGGGINGAPNHIKKFTTQPYVVNSENWSIQKINPFIVLNSGDTIYLAIYSHNLEQYNYNDVVSLKGYPYGIALEKAPWSRETIPMASAYYNFNSWILGDDSQLNINYDNSKVVNPSFVNSEVNHSPENLSWNK